MIAVPQDIQLLLDAGVIRPDQATALISVHGIVTLRDLHDALSPSAVRERPAALDGLHTIGTTLRRPSRVPLGRATDLVEPVVAMLASAAAVEWAQPVGSLRRGFDFVGDLEVLAATSTPDLVLDRLARTLSSSDVVHREPDRVYLRVDGTQIGVRCVAPNAAGAHLLHYTGSLDHLRALAERARARRATLDRNGLRTGAGQVIAAEEADIYGALDLPFIEPELRNGTGEIDAAERGNLPHLVTSADIRGDLHMHSHWSDGRDPIEAMVVSAIGLGYEYIAITDHSQRSAASRNLRVDDVARQSEEIAHLREAYPQIAILHGCEVDILDDGSLDFADDILSRFDIVLASLHERHGHDAVRLLERYERAMRHPLVALVTHPTNRLMPHRVGYDLDYDRLFQLAVETGTLLEVDGAPSHLDLDADLARRAVAAGVMLTIDSDCHRADRLGRQMQFGVLTARRGWVEPRHVLNTRPLADVRSRIAAKRSARVP